MRPRLARRARLRRDRVSGRWMVLYPERGLLLNDSAAEIVALCTGEQTRDAIVTALAGRHAVPAEQLASQVDGLLEALAERGLITWEAGSVNQLEVVS